MTEDMPFLSVRRQNSIYITQDLCYTKGDGRTVPYALRDKKDPSERKQKTRSSV